MCVSVQLTDKFCFNQLCLETRQYNSLYVQCTHFNVLIFHIGLERQLLQIIGAGGIAVIKFCHVVQLIITNSNFFKISQIVLISVVPAFLAYFPNSAMIALHLHIKLFSINCF